MALTKHQISTIIDKYGSSSKDTGSVETQVALLTADIENITNHLKVQKKDFSSKRGLQKKTSTRKKLLSYLKKNDIESYHALVKKLGLRG